MTIATPETQPLPVLAAQLLRSARAGVLSTISTHLPGWPFGSLAPYAVDKHGNLVLVLSDLAEHTRNLRADSRASLFVQDPSVPADAQAGARICVLGHLRAEADGPSMADARARYVARFAEAAAYLTKLDFHLYVLTVESVRVIGGFGRIAWLDGATMRVDPAGDALAAAAPDILAHMNTDHAEALRLYCAAFRAHPGPNVTMMGIDEWGFDVCDRDSNERFRFDFAERVTSPDGARKVLVALVRDARAKLGTTG